MDPAFTFDLTDRNKVIQHVRNLLNLAPLLDRGIDEELGQFIKRLGEVGWGNKQISDILTYGAQNNRYERMKDHNGKPLLPRPIPERGDQAEWRLLKPRAKK